MRRLTTTSRRWRGYPRSRAAGDNALSSAQLIRARSRRPIGLSASAGTRLETSPIAQHRGLRLEPHRSAASARNARRNGIMLPSGTNCCLLGTGLADNFKNKAAKLGHERLCDSEMVFGTPVSSVIRNSDQRRV